MRISKRVLSILLTLALTLGLLAVTPLTINAASTYTLTVNGGFGGGNYEPDARVVISAYPAPTGQVFDKWVADDGAFDNDESATTTFHMPAAHVTVTALYRTATAYTLTVKGGMGGGNYEPDARVVISTYPAPTGQVFDKWVADDGAFDNEESATTTFHMPAAHVTVTATYKTAPPVTGYTLTVTGGTGGGTYAAGVSASITATVPAGQVFDHWTATGGGFADPYAPSTAFTMPAANATVTAVFKLAPPDTYTLTVVSGAGGGNYASGAVVTVTAFVAPAGQVFDKWTMTGGGTLADEYSASTTYTMPVGMASVTATYKAAPIATYTLTVANGTGGGTYAAGAVVVVTADAPPAGKVFDKWTATAGGFADTYSQSTAFIMPAGAATVTATYKNEPENTYALTVANGTPSGYYTAGSSVTVIADAPPAGKVFDKWTATAGGFADAYSASTAFTMPAGIATVTALYKAAPPDTYTLAVVGGTGDGNYTAGQSVTVTATVPAGKVFDKWTTTAGGFADPKKPTTAFTMPDSSATVTAIYRDVKYVGLFGLNTKHESSFWNWFKFVALFGFIWMWFI